MPGGKSSVDESLFASKGNKKSTQGGPAVPTAGLVISRSELAKIKQMGVIETYAQKQARVDTQHKRLSSKAGSDT